MKKDEGISKEVLDWLLEPEDALVRYATLIELLGRGKNDQEVVESHRAMMVNPQVLKILTKQQPGGFWQKPEDFYVRSKYKGTVWNVILLAEMGADGSDERIKNACEFLLEWSQDRESGGFAFYDSKRDKRREQIGPCLTGNLVWCMIRFGYLNDARIQKGIEWIATYQRADDGSKPPSEWPYAKYEACWGKHTCMMGVVKGLKALAEIPESKRNSLVKSKIAELAEFILAHHLYQRSQHPGQVAKEAWIHFGFPLFWSTDALEMLEILMKLGIHDDRMQDAISLLQSKQDETGRWLQEDDYFNGRMLVKFENSGEPSKRVTLKALKILKEWNR
jgi:hypothetical protein